VSDVTVSLDSSDIPVILNALELKRASLARGASKKLKIEQQPLLAQIELLINTFESIQQ
jgi:hypothetical protein